MKGRSRSFFLVLAAIPFIACSSGCDRYAKHKVLTFFFTGVPPLDEGGKGPEKEMEAAKKAEQGPRQRKRRPFVEATRFSHGPYASGACYLCHETSETGGFRGFSKEAKAAGSIAKPGIVPGELVAPLRELCVGCHAGGFVFNESLHEGKGECRSCHNAHVGRNSRMLTAEYRETW